MAKNILITDLDGKQLKVAYNQKPIQVVECIREAQVKLLKDGFPDPKVLVYEIVDKPMLIEFAQ